MTDALRWTEDDIRAVLQRLTNERDGERAKAKEGETLQHDLAAARSWAFGLAVSLLDGTEPA